MKFSELAVGCKLRSKESIAKEARIECISIEKDVATFKRINDFTEPFKLNEDNFENSGWVLVEQ